MIRSDSTIIKNSTGCYFTIIELWHSYINRRQNNICEYIMDKSNKLIKPKLLVTGGSGLVGNSIKMFQKKYMHQLLKNINYLV